MMILLSCNADEEERLQQRIVVLEATIDSLMFGAERLYSQAEQLIHQGKLIEAQDVLKDLQTMHPGTMEANRAESLSFVAKSLHEDMQQAQQLLQEQQQSDPHNYIAHILVFWFQNH